MKWALVGLCTLAALGAWAMGLNAAAKLSGEVHPLPVPKVAMRPLPPLQGGPASAVQQPPAEKAPPAEGAAEPTRAAEPVVAKEPPASEVAAPSKASDEPKTVATAKEPAGQQQPPKAAPTAAPKPTAADESPAPAPQPKARPAAGSESGSTSPPAPVGEGSINLKASDTAEVVIDGRKVGPSPKLGVKLKAGKHKIRFDCYDENGNLKPGKVQVVDIAPDEEQDLDYECPLAQ